MKAREEALKDTLARVFQLQGNHYQAVLDLSEAPNFPSKEPKIQTNHPSETSVLVRAGARCNESPALTGNEERNIPSHNKPPKPTPRLSLLQKWDERYPAYAPPRPSSQVEHFSHVSLDVTPMSRSQSENSLSCLNSGLAKDTHSHPVACGLQSKQTPNPNIDEKLRSRWSLSARSFFQDKDQRTLDWKQRLRRLGKSWKARFKPSNATRSVPCLSPPHLLRPPDQ